MMQGAPFEPSPYDEIEEFRVARPRQDPDASIEDTQGRIAQSRRQLDQFIRKKQNSTLLPQGSVVEPATTPYLPFSDPFEIRILEVFPGDFADPIQGNLHYASVEFEYVALEDVYPTWTRRTGHAVSLKEGRPVCYTALSYVWGAPEFECTVHINGFPKAITRNLDTTIRYLRQQDCSVMLWIDQLCIDQSDESDKASQVQLMGLIYQRAWNTVIWLGEGPEQGAFQALQDLRETTQGREEDITAEERDLLRSRLNEYPRAFETLKTLFEQSWFRRTWIIQETILSNSPFVMVGSSACHWDDFGEYCVSIENFRIFDGESITHRNSPIAQQFSGLEVAVELWKNRASYRANSTGNILLTLVNTRYAGVSNPSDKVYGILGVCEHDVIPDYSQSHGNVFWEVAVRIVQQELSTLDSRRKPGQQAWLYGSMIFKLLCCVDHERLGGDIPSWVPDWSKPRLTTSLGYSSSAFSCFNAGGPPLPDVAFLNADGDTLMLHAKIWDRIDSISEIFTSAYLSADNPIERNTSLKFAMAFAISRCPEAEEDTEGLFISFCKTMVAGKAGSGIERYPSEYTEILSLLCDETSGQGAPTFKDQIYSSRQKKGRFTLANLKVRTASRAFQGLKRAHEAAMVNRRLCWTEGGFLGLVPRDAREHDWIAVLPGSAVPFVLRESHVRNEFEFIGESYVNAIMNGEAMARASLPLTKIHLV